MAKANSIMAYLNSRQEVIRQQMTEEQKAEKELDTKARHLFKQNQAKSDHVKRYADAWRNAKLKELNDTLAAHGFVKAYGNALTQTYTSKKHPGKQLRISGQCFSLHIGADPFQPGTVLQSSQPLETLAKALEHLNGKK
jgi:hypothetical protein